MTYWSVGSIRGISCIGVMKCARGESAIAPRALRDARKKPLDINRDLGTNRSPRSNDYANDAAVALESLLTHRCSDCLRVGTVLTLWRNTITFPSDDVTRFNRSFPSIQKCTIYDTAMLRIVFQVRTRYLPGHAAKELARTLAGYAESDYRVLLYCFVHTTA